MRNKFSIEFQTDQIELVYKLISHYTNNIDLDIRQSPAPRNSEYELLGYEYHIDRGGNWYKWYVNCDLFSDEHHLIVKAVAKIKNLLGQVIQSNELNELYEMGAHTPLDGYYQSYKLTHEDIRMQYAAQSDIKVPAALFNPVPLNYATEKMPRNTLGLRMIQTIERIFHH